MIGWDILSALYISLIFTIIYSVGFGHMRGWGSMLSGFFLIFFAIWAIGRWTARSYLVTHGAFGLTSLVIALIVLLVLTAIIPSRLEHSAKHAGAVLSVRKFYQKKRFWIVMVFFIIFIICDYTLFSENVFKGPPPFYNGPDTLEQWQK